MAEIGIVAVGPSACSLRMIQHEVPVLRVCAEKLEPLEEDFVATVREVGPRVFSGPDSDRWCLLPARELVRTTEILWASSQVHQASIKRAVAGWENVLLFAWADDTALIPALRALPQGLSVTILLGGPVRPDDPAVRRNHVVLAESIRRKKVQAVIHSVEPEYVLSFALDSARDPVSLDYPPAKAVDIGPFLDLPATWSLPEPGAEIFRLKHRSLRRATHLPALVLHLASYQVLQGLLHGPPMEVEGVTVVNIQELRDELPGESIFEDLRSEINRALSSVEFVGNEPLVDEIERVLRPLSKRIQRLIRVVDEIEAQRLLRLRAFGAAGIAYTVQRLRTHLDNVQGRELERVDIDGLLQGRLNTSTVGSTSTAWRHLFDGVSGCIRRRGAPGWQVARRLVKDRFTEFRAHFATMLARYVADAVSAAKNPDSPLPASSVRSLHHRALQVVDALEGVLSSVHGQVLAGCENAIRQDAVIRWIASDPDELRESLERELTTFGVMAELERVATVAMSRRPLGMAEGHDFEVYLHELVEDISNLTSDARTIPSYGAVLYLLLEQRDPKELRSFLTESTGLDPILSLSEGTDTNLMQWFANTGMRVEIRSIPPCVVYWEQADVFTDAAAEEGRCGVTEHRLADLVLSPPEGDTAQAIAAWVDAVSLLLAGLIVGDLTLTREEGVQSILVKGDGLSEYAFLPFGALHQLAIRSTVRHRLAARVGRRLDKLASRSDGLEALQKLTELAELGCSPRLSEQIGLGDARFIHVLPAVRALLSRLARRGIVSMVDHRASEEIVGVLEAPKRHRLIDLFQLPPLGV